MAWSSFPVFPSDDGWPYPDLPGGFDDPAADDEVDLDALELRADPHAFESLSATEYELVARRFGFQAPHPPHRRVVLTGGQHSLQRPRPARLASSSSRSIVRACAWLGSMTSRRA
jgi:hypothetical protein